MLHMSKKYVSWWMHHFRRRVSWTSELVMVSPEKLLSGMAAGKSASASALKGAFTTCAIGPSSAYSIIPHGLREGEEKAVLKFASLWKIFAGMTADAAFQQLKGKSMTLQRPDGICNWCGGGYTLYPLLQGNYFGLETTALQRHTPGTWLLD